MNCQANVPSPFDDDGCHPFATDDGFLRTQEAQRLACPVCGVMYRPDLEADGHACSFRQAGAPDLSHAEWVKGFFLGAFLSSLLWALGVVVWGRVFG